MQIKRLTYNEKEAAVEVLASAFYDYPVMRYVLNNSGENYPEHLNALVGFFCETRLTRKWPLLGIENGEKIVAVAGINEPVDKPWPQKLHDIYAQLRETIGDAAFTRLEDYENRTTEIQPEYPHFFLGIIGVHPSHQGKGLARKIIDELRMMSEKNPDSTGICLHTEDINNVRIYEHLGFRTVCEISIESLNTWCMFRPD